MLFALHPGQHLLDLLLHPGDVGDVEANRSAANDTLVIDPEVGRRGCHPVELRADLAFVRTQRGRPVVQGRGPRVAHACLG